MVSPDFFVATQTKNIYLTIVSFVQVMHSLFLLSFLTWLNITGE